MATIATLVLELKLDKGSFNSDVTSAKSAMDDLDNSSNNNKQSMDKLGVSAKNIGKLMAGAVVAGIAAATAAFLKSTKAAGDYDVALTTLGATLRAAGVEDFDAAIEKAEQFAASLQRLTGISDVATLKAQAVGAAFGLTGKTLEDATVAAANMATVLGGDVAARMRLVGQAASGNISVLARYVKTLKGVENGALTAAEIIQRVNEQFGDAAVAAAQNYTGRLNILQATMGDVVKETGFIFTRSKELNALFEELEQTVFNLTQSIAENRDNMQSFVRDGVEVAVDGVRVLTIALGAAGIALNALGVLGNGLVAILVKAFEGIIRVVGSTIKEFRLVAEALGADKIAATFKRAEESVGGFGDKIRDTAEVFADSSNDNIDSMAKIAKAIKTTDKAIKDFGERVKERAKDIKVLGDGAKTAANDFNGLAKAIDSSTESLTAADLAFGSLSVSIVDASGVSTEFEDRQAALQASFEATAQNFVVGQAQMLASGEQSAVGLISAAARTAAAFAAQWAFATFPFPASLGIAAGAIVAAELLVGALKSFHEGSDILKPRDLLSLPGMQPGEGLAVLQTGEKVQSRAEVREERRIRRVRGDATVMNENFSQMIPTSRAALRRGLRTGGVRAEIRRSRRS